MKERKKSGLLPKKDTLYERTYRRRKTEPTSGQGGQKKRRQRKKKSLKP